MTKRILFFALFLGCFVPAFGQVTVAPFTSSQVQFFDNSGNPCAGCLLSTFAAGTTTPLATYSDLGVTLNANPIVLDSAGRAVIYLQSASYKFVLKTAASATIFTQDNVTWLTPLSSFAGLASAGNFDLTQPTAATSLANHGSFNNCLHGTYWTGSVSADDKWCFSNVLGSGANPTSTLTLVHSGSSGTATINFPSLTFSNLTVGGAINTATLAASGNATIGGTLGVTGNTALGGPSPWIDVTSPTYGCKGDGATDDSVCLQAAFTAAINAHTCAYLPPKTFKHASTLNVNVGVQGLCLRGNGMQPNISGASILLYTGATTQLSATDGTTFSFGYDFDGIVLEAGANATNAFIGNNISEFRFKRVGIWSDGTHKFTNGWNCSGCNIGTWEQWIVSNVGNAVVLTSTAQSPSASLDFISADTFQVTNIFTISGQANNITDIAGWHETQNTVLLVDDTSVATSLTAIYFSNTRMLFNGALATFPDSLLMKVNNVAGNVMTLHQVNFDHVAYSTNQAVAFPISITEANASSIVWLGIGGNSSFQGATTGLINTSLTGGTAGLRLNLYGLESVNSSLAILTPNVAGTGSLQTDSEFGGITGNGSVTLNASGSFVALGVNPAASGIFRAPNNIVAVAGRNAANNADINLLYAGTDNKAHLGIGEVIDSGGLTFASAGFINMVETTSPGGVAGNDVCYPDSTLHALKCNYNNVGYFQMAQVITATSAAFATATTAGTCVQNTTAVAGATTAMVANASPVSTPGVGAQWSAFVSSAGNVTINECAVAVSAGGTIAFNIRVIP